MPRREQKMRCPDCGVEMNHHAVKLVEPRNAREVSRVDPELGAVVAEVHACPECGAGAVRHPGG